MAIYYALNTNKHSWNIDCLHILSETVTGRCVPFNTFLHIILDILSMSACLGKYLCTKFLLLTCVCNTGDYCRYFFLGLSYISWMILSCWGAFSSKSTFRSGSIPSTSTGSSSIVGGWYGWGIVSMDISGSLGGDGERIRSLYTGNLYLDWFGGVLPPTNGIAEGGGSGLVGTIDGSAGLDCSCGKSCNFDPVIFLAPALPCSFSR